MNTLLLKIFITPTIIGTASLAGRRWGHSISGWLIALPLTTGPVTFFLALTHGTSFAATSAAGTLAGGFSQAAFVLCYARLAAHWKWFPTLAASILSFAVCTFILQRLTFPLIPLCLFVFLCFALAIRLLPHTTTPVVVTDSLPARWDIPMRMVIATVFVLLITGLAPAFGPRLTGLISPFPIFTATMAAFAHHQYGLDATVNVLRGLLMGLYAFASFFFVLAILLEPSGILTAFTVAILVVISLQSISFWLLRRRAAAIKRI